MCPLLSFFVVFLLTPRIPLRSTTWIKANYHTVSPPRTSSASACQLVLPIVDVTKLNGQHWTLSLSLSTSISACLCAYVSWVKLTGRKPLIKTKRRFYVLSTVTERERERGGGSSERRGAEYETDSLPLLTDTNASRIPYVPLRLISLYDFLHVQSCSFCYLHQQQLLPVESLHRFAPGPYYGSSSRQTVG